MSAPPTPNIVLVGGGPPNPDPNPGAGPYPAENGFFGNGSVFENTNGGFNGMGYVNFPANGGFLEFGNVEGGGGGSRTLRFRYALGATATRTGRLIVNGVSQNITFTPTGAWTTWANFQVTVNMNGGATNTVRLESTGQDLANIDELQLQ
ncbi:MAG: carbohydrate-binding protein [Pyrinomonadaceae bacterium]|nr:carbohydrate-binding protein [Pyrinomonadaceae bacterium]